MGGKDNAGVTNSPGKFQGLVGFFITGFYIS